MNKKRTAFFAVFIGIAALSTACAFETLEPCEGEECEEIRETSLLAIYGTDNRVEYSAATTQQRGWADAVGGLVPRSMVSCPAGAANCTMTLDSPLGGSTVEVIEYDAAGAQVKNLYPVCSGEAFDTQYTAPACSGFLVGPDLVATAGHCFDGRAFGADGRGSLDAAELTRSCSNMSFVFGFTKESINAATTTANVPAANHYRCTAVVEAQLDITENAAQTAIIDKRDWAVFRLDRAVTGRKPHAFRRSGRLAPREALSVVGHPWGLPMKIAASGKTEAPQSGRPEWDYLWNARVFQHSADTEGGNSGSPIINSGSGMVEGIHIASPGSFQADKTVTPACARWKKCPSTGCAAPESQWGEAIRTPHIRTLAPSLAPKLFDQRTATVNGTYTAFTGDFDGDGESDMYWFGPGAAADSVAWGKSNMTFTAGTDSTGTDYKPFTGDFDRDGYTDIFWYGPGATQDRLSWGRSDRTFGSDKGYNTAGIELPNAAANVYTPLVGDFDGDGFSDIFWYAPGAAADLQWFGGGGGRRFIQTSTAVAETFDKALVGDFNGDGRSDVFWYSRLAKSYVSYGTAARTFTRVEAKDTAAKVLPQTTWTSILVGDFDGDGRSDLYFYVSGATADLQWFGTAGNSFNATADQTSVVYKPVVGDFNGDALDDIFWYSETTTDKISWGASTRTFPTANQPFSISTGYRLIVGDYDGNSAKDLYAYSPGNAGENIYYGRMKP